MEQATPCYLFRECSTPNCFVMIGWEVGSIQGIATCKWCQAGAAYYADGSFRRNRELNGAQP